MSEIISQVSITVHTKQQRIQLRHWMLLLLLTVITEYCAKFQIASFKYITKSNEGYISKID